MIRLLQANLSFGGITDIVLMAELWLYKFVAAAVPRYVLGQPGLAYANSSISWVLFVRCLIREFFVSLLPQHVRKY